MNAIVDCWVNRVKKTAQKGPCGLVICDSQRLYFADDSEHGPYEAVDVNTGLVWVYGERVRYRVTPVSI
jgi:hypothetical protein